MKKIWSIIILKLKAWHIINKICFLCATDTSSITPIPMSGRQLIFSPFTLLVDNIKEFIVLGCFYSGILSIIALAMGYSLICTIDNGTSLYCSSSNGVYLFYAILKIFIFAIFTNRWIHLVFLHQSLKIVNLIKITKLDLRMFFSFTFYIFVNFIPLISLYLLYIRAPNADWLVEIFFFGIVSLGFLTPLIAIRFISMFILISENKPLPRFSTVWKISRGNMLKIIMSFALLFITTLFLLGGFINNIKGAISPDNGLYLAI